MSQAEVIAVPITIEHLPHICKIAGCTYPRVRIDHKRSEYFCAKHLGLTDSLLGSSEKVR